MDQFNLNTINAQNIALKNKNSDINNKDNTIFQQGRELINEQSKANTLKSQVDQLAQQKYEMEEQVRNAHSMKIINEVKAEAVTQENEKLKAVLNRPLMEIISENERLRAAMDKQQALLEEWMLSQKAFKVLAVKYGEKTNVSDEKFAKDIDLAKNQIKEGKKMAEIKLT